MAKKLFRVTSYYIDNEMPAHYPIPLHIEESEVNTFQKANVIYENGCNESSVVPGKSLFCMRVQEYRIDDSRGLVYCDDMLKMGTHPYYTYGCYKDCQKFSYGDVVEVIDGDSLTLGIIIHKPWALSERRLVIMPQWYYKYTVLVYKNDNTIHLMELTETQMISGRGIVARSIVKALKEESRNICVQE